MRVSACELSREMVHRRGVLERPARAWRQGPGHKIAVFTSTLTKEIAGFSSLSSRTHLSKKKSVFLTRNPLIR